MNLPLLPSGVQYCTHNHENMDSAALCIGSTYLLLDFVVVEYYFVLEKMTNNVTILYSQPVLILLTYMYLHLCSRETLRL